MPPDFVVSRAVSNGSGAATATAALNGNGVAKAKTKAVAKAKPKVRAGAPKPIGARKTRGTSRDPRTSRRAVSALSTRPSNALLKRDSTEPAPMQSPKERICLGGSSNTTSGPRGVDVGRSRRGMSAIRRGPSDG